MLAEILPAGTDVETADDALMAAGHGITDLLKAPSPRDEASDADLTAGVGPLWQKIALWRPAAVVFIYKRAATIAAGRELEEPWGQLMGVAMAGRPCFLMPGRTPRPSRSTRVSTCSGTWRRHCRPIGVDRPPPPVRRESRRCLRSTAGPARTPRAGTTHTGNPKPAEHDRGGLRLPERSTKPVRRRVRARKKTSMQSPRGRRGASRIRGRSPASQPPKATTKRYAQRERVDLRQDQSHDVDRGQRTPLSNCRRPMPARPATPPRRRRSRRSSKDTAGHDIGRSARSSQTASHVDDAEDADHGAVSAVDPVRG